MAAAAKRQADKAESISTSIANAVTELHGQSRAAQDQAKAAQDSAAAIQDQVGALRKQFQLDQRPYINVWCCASVDATAGTASEPTIGKPLYFNVSYTNVGKTPAIHAVPRFHVLSGYGADDIHADPPDEFPVGYGVTIPPHLDQPQISPVVSVKNTFAIKEIGDIKQSNMIPWDGGEPIIVFGRVTYSDNFGNRYCAPILNHWLRGGGWANAASLDLDRPQKHTVKLTDFCPPGASL